VEKENRTEQVEERKEKKDSKERLGNWNGEEELEEGEEEEKKRGREQVTAGDPSTLSSRTLSVYFLSPNQPCRYS
jgi:hypothetical protein